MKKLFTSALTVVMAAGLSISAVAAESSAAANTSPTTLTESGATKDIAVKAVYVDNTDMAGEVSATVEWGKMEFTYTVGGTKEWNADDHSYSLSNSTSGWSEEGNTVKVTNHSNVDINTTFTYTQVNTALTGTLTYDKTASNGTVKLNKGAVNSAATADSVTATLTLSGTPSSTMTTMTEVGKVTVRIKALSDTIKASSATFENDVKEHLLTGATTLKVELDEATAGMQAFGKIKTAATAAATELGKTDAFVDLTLTGTGYTQIVDAAFEWCTWLRSLSAPNMTQVGNSAFLGCTKLVEVNLPAVTDIQKKAFNNCPALTTLTFGAKITTMVTPWMGGTTNAANITLTLNAAQTDFVASDNLANKRFGGLAFKEIQYAE